MKNHLPVLLGVLLLSGLSARATEALQDIQSYGYIGVNDEETGFGFVTETNFTVTRLGFQFDSSESDSSYVVRLVDGDGGQLAAVTVNAPAAPTNQLVYAAITPVELASGSTNFLLCYDAYYFASNAVKHWDNPLILVDDPGSGSFNVAAEIIYLGASLSTNLIDPTNAANFLYVGPNFEFTTEPVVNPSSLTISLTSSNTVQLIWPAADTVGQLQSSTNLLATMTDVTNAPVVVGTSNVVELPLTPPEAYFRLKY